MSGVTELSRDAAYCGRCVTERDGAYLGFAASEKQHMDTMRTGGARRTGHGALPEQGDDPQHRYTADNVTPAGCR